MSALFQPTKATFEGFLNTTLRRVDALGGTRRELPIIWSNAIGGEGKFQLKANSWLLWNGKAEIRLVVIESKTSQIMNLLAYPHQNLPLPLFAAEIMLVQGTPRLFFVDIPCPDVDNSVRLHARMLSQECLRIYQSFSYEEEAPLWSRSFSPGAYLYSRPNKIDSLPELISAFGAYFDTWINLLVVIQEGVTPAPSSLELSEFKRLQRTESPGVSYLEKFFGTEWTQCFLRDFLHS